MSVKNNFLYATVFFLAAFGVANAVELTGTVSVNETADTADTAKSNAFNAAQRQVIIQELRSYANPTQLTAAVKNSSNEELMNIISSSSLDSEKISNTTYSANISFVIDGDAARAWMDRKSVQHWLPSSGGSSNVATVVAPTVNTQVVNAVLLRPISDWMNLNAVARGARIDLILKSMTGNRISFAVPEKDISRFISAGRANGWQVQSDADGIKMWK